MDLKRYRQFSDDLRRGLESDSRVLGLVALGSMAEVGRTPDEWSDHDFFVITRSGEQRAFRVSSDWLPDAAHLVLFFQETPHGCKALYESGHLLEFAVFDPDEIALARVNDYRVLFDRERVAERMRNVAARSENRPDRKLLAGMFLTNLVVACARDARGETASARSMLLSAVRHLTQLLAPTSPDNLDPLRRFEQVSPEAGKAIESAMRLPVRRAAEALLDLFERTAGSPDDIRAVFGVRRLVSSS